MINISKTRIKDLMNVFKQDYTHLACHLKLMNDVMVLVNPDFKAPAEKEQQKSDAPNEDRQKTTQDQHQEDPVEIKESDAEKE